MISLLLAVRGRELLFVFLSQSLNIPAIVVYIGNLKTDNFCISIRIINCQGTRTIVSLYQSLDIPATVMYLRNPKANNIIVFIIIIINCHCQGT